MPSKWHFNVTELSSLRPARLAFRALLTSLQPEGCDVASGELVFGELVANALLHGDPKAAEILVERAAGRVTLSVKSGGLPFTFSPAAPDRQQTRGRGFQIVAALSSEVSVKREGSTSTITASLRLTGS